MKRKLSKKVIIIIAAAMMGIIAVVIAACGGNDIEGTWYDAEKASETAYTNMDFKSDGTVTCEGVSGKYKVDGNMITVNILGKEFACELKEFKGYDVLYSNWTESYYSKDLEEAKEIKKLLDEGTDEEADVDDEEYADYDEEENEEDPSEGFDEEYAKEQGGLYVQSKNKYYPLGHKEDTSEDYADVLTGKGDALYINEGQYYIPKLGKNDKLVFFSDSETPEEVYACKAVKSGYTLPLYLEEEYDEISAHAKTIDEEGEMEDIEVETIDGKKPKEYKKGMMFINKDEEYKSEQLYIKDCKKNQIATVGYHEGTEYRERDISASVKYYDFGYKESDSLKLNLGKESYAVVDASKLKSGTYALKAGENGNWSILEVE